jgi:c-di-GMP-binding flagellar brake protein YcgR
LPELGVVRTVPVVPAQPIPTAQHRVGYLNENLQLEVIRVGGSALVRTTIDTLQAGYALGLRPSDDAGDLDEFQGGDAVRARFSRHHDATYEFASRVLEVDIAGGRLWLTAPINIERIQARRHVRVATDLAALMAPAGPRRIDATLNEFVSVTVPDISAGGLAIRTGHDLKVDATVLIDLTVPDRRSPIRVETRARVVRGRIDSGSDEPTCFRYGLEYLGLGSRQEADLVGAIFRRLSELRRA